MLTALAGSLPDRTVLTPWDAECGFSAGDDVVAARLAEDREALAVLAGHQRVLEGLDSQYGPQPDRASIIRTGIETVLADLDPPVCLIPLGLQHEDHIETRRIASLVATVADAGTSSDWVVYEELPYGPNDGDHRHHDEAFAAYGAAGFRLTEITPALDPSMEAKARAVERYASQLLALRRYNPQFDHQIVTERYWAVSRS